MASRDSEGKSRLWLASLDRRSPPRQIPDVDGAEPAFAAADEIVFRRGRALSAFAYRVRIDGTGLRQASDRPIVAILGASPDGQWLVAAVREQDLATTQATFALPIRGGPPVRVYASDGRLKWHRDANVIVLTVGRPTERGPSAVPARSYILPLPRGRVLPVMPAEGFQSETEIAKVPGVRMIESADVTPGPTPRRLRLLARSGAQKSLPHSGVVTIATFDARLNPVQTDLQQRSIV